MISLLIIEDDEYFGPSVLRMASALGYETVLCKSTEDALELWKDGDFDGVVSDIVLCDGAKSGLDFIIEAKPTRAVIMSGKITAEVGEHLLVGMVFLAKPFSIHQLQVALQRAGLTI